MKKLHQNPTRIFCQLLDKLGDHTYCKLSRENFMPLVIEQVGENIQTPFGIGKLISLAHYYTQNGDTMRDPEMVFIVVDNRKETNQYEAIGIYPQLYRQDSFSLNEESICIDACQITTFKPVWQAGHTSFANQWLLNIRSQGFLKAIPKHL